MVMVCSGPGREWGREQTREGVRVWCASLWWGVLSEGIVRGGGGGGGGGFTVAQGGHCVPSSLRDERAPIVSFRAVRMYFFSSRFNSKEQHRAKGVTGSLEIVFS